MFKSLFFPSNSLSNIKANVITLHALALLIGGAYLLYAISLHDNDAIQSQQVTAYLTITFGLFNFVAAKLKNKTAIAIGLLIWFSLLAFRSFQVIDPSFTAVGVNIAFLSLIVLLTLFYSPKVGLVFLAAVTVLNIARWTSTQYDLIQFTITENTGIFETNVLVIFSIYSCFIAGYYQYQVVKFVAKLQHEKRALSIAIGELRRKRTKLTEVVAEIEKVTYEAVPSFKPMVSNQLEILKNAKEKPVSTYSSTILSGMKDVDLLLRSIDQTMEEYDKQ
jgi:hypothetical protein